MVSNLRKKLQTLWRKWSTVLRKPLAVRLFKTAVVVAMSYLLSWGLMQPFSLSPTSLVQTEDLNDFSITDFYNKVADGRNVRTLDKNIVIVDIGNADRQGIAELMELIALCQPRTVGVDIIFTDPREGDATLIAAASLLPNAVFAGTLPSHPHVDDEHSGIASRLHERTYFIDSLPNAVVGITNMPTKMDGGVVRNFLTSFVDEETHDTYYSFVLQLAAKFTGRSVDDVLPAGHDDTMVINYPSHEFRKLDYDAIVEHPEWLTDKIVILGALNDERDMHRTALGKKLAGMEIHAYATATIVNGDFLHSLSERTNALIAIVLCFIFSYLGITLDVGYKGLVLRVVQLAMLYVIVRVGYHFFLNHGVVIDFSFTFLMVAFGLFACDIFIGLNTLKNRAIRKYKSKTKSN